jgi:surface polysaccharide O-acyltransferase-like enzyme
MTDPKASRPHDAIGIARVLCILGIVYVHGWTGLTAEKFEMLAATPQGIERWSLIELIGRCAVPLLGAISGWLSGPSAAKRSYGAFVRVKARTILAPMILWDLLAFSVSAAAVWGTLQAPVPRSLWEAFDWTVCLTQANPINVQISFLRDLFVCMLFAPVLARARPWALWTTLAVAILWSFTQPALHDWLSPPLVDPTAWSRTAHAAHDPFAWATDAIVGHLLLRPPILVFFATGMLVRRYGIAERVMRWPLWACAIPYAVLAPIKVWLSVTNEAWEKANPGLVNVIDLPMRFAAALLIWKIALMLVPTRSGRFIARGERYIFLLFCSHLIVLWLGGPVLGGLTGPMGSPLWAPYFLLQPLIVLAITVPMAWGLEWLSRPLASILSGGRLATPLKPDLPRGAASAMEPANPIAGAPRP